MTECTALGMPLVVKETDKLAESQPISALVIVKAIDSDGKLFYCLTATEDLHTVETMGMLEFAMKRIRARL